MCRAIPGRIVEVDPAADLALRIAKVDFSGITKAISLSLTPEARLGDYVLVHVGFALTVISEAEAEKTIAFPTTIATAEGPRREFEPTQPGEGV